METTSILLATGYFVLVTALITLIIKFANYKDDTEKDLSEKDILLHDFISGREEIINENVQQKQEIERQNTYIKELKAHLDSEHANSKKLRETIAVKTKSESSLQRKVEVLSEENKFLIEHGPKVLKLNVAAKLYDKLVDGTEIAVPLSYKNYWKKQLLNDQNDLKEFHLAEVSNGRRKGYETAKFIVNYIELAQKDKSNEDSKFFHVYLGERLN
ncbi:hypothetical protein KC717_04555 [Candidatus Dojkabacteria bacterium]|uniref:Uncharacterized protein n=1 Tax=Candidatus Dojkabacteria bacterium TaxID=2099670 RepID=A0A955L968_9BACT|nr:hypothetical protein [Candidatus Dojkabacteria bacterium]